MIAHSILATLMTQPGLVSALEIQPDDMPTVELRLILETVVESIEQVGATDLQLVRNGLDLAYPNYSFQGDLDEIYNSIGAPANFGAYQAQLLSDNRTRAAKAIGGELNDTGDVESALSALSQLTVSDAKSVHGAGQGEALLTASLEFNKPVSTGIRKLDKEFGGFHKSDLVVLGARPSMGKTALAANIALRSGVPFLFVSGEQSAAQLMQRFVSIEGGVPLWRMRNRDLPPDDYQQALSTAKALSQGAWSIYDSPAPSLAQIVTEARKQRLENSIELIVVDYLQRMKTQGERREGVEANVRGLKELARELNIPVVCLAQVNRSVDTRQESKVPRMGDLMESGSIEAEADMVMMLFREYVYDKTKDKTGALLTVEKNRHGPTGHLSLRFSPEFLRFESVEAA